MQPHATKPPPLLNLTAVRLFAACLVLFFHLSQNGRALQWTQPIHPFLAQGFTGVSVFFVLSGFVLAYNHLEVKQPIRFYLARFARVYPLYLFALLWMALFQFMAAYRLHSLAEAQLPAFFASAFMVQTWYMPIALSFNIPGWSLSTEAFFYLLFPLLIPFVLRNTKSYRRWMVSIWLAFLVLPVLMNYGQTWFGLSFSVPVAGFLHGVLISPPSRVGEFLLGMFAGARFRKHPWVASGWMVLAAVLVCLTAIYFSGHVAHEVIRDDAMALLYTILLVFLAAWKSPILESAPFQIGGEISFGIYLLQYPLMVTMLGIQKRFHIFSWKIPMLVILPCLAFLTYNYIEKPARKMILNFFHLRGGPKPIPTTANLS